MNCNLSMARSPVLMTGFSSEALEEVCVPSILAIEVILTVWRIPAACNTIHDPTDNVVAWCRQRISASNVRNA